MERLAIEEAKTPFDLRRGPLWRLRLLRRSPQEHILVVTSHHFVSDRWSMAIISKEISAGYAALAAGGPMPLGDPPGQYADIATGPRGRLRAEAIEEQLASWGRELGGGVPELRLPADLRLSSPPTYRGGRRHFGIDAGLSAALRDLGAREA